MCQDNDFKVFNLKKACKNCPFKINSGMLLNGGRIQSIMDDFINDKGFICHKTISDSGTDLRELEECIEDEVDYISGVAASIEEIEELRKSLQANTAYAELSKQYEADQKNEMYCAGVLILAKKEDLLLHNRATRFAIGKDLLNPNQFFDEHEVYESIESAVNAHNSFDL